MQHTLLGLNLHGSNFQSSTCVNTLVSSSKSRDDSEVFHRYLGRVSYEWGKGVRRLTNFFLSKADRIVKDTYLGMSHIRRHRPKKKSRLPKTHGHESETTKTRQKVISL